MATANQFKEDTAAATVAAIHSAAAAKSSHRNAECSTKFTTAMTPIEHLPVTASTATADGLASRISVATTYRGEYPGSHCVAA
jgi:hypothetical protein